MRVRLLATLVRFLVPMLIATEVVAQAAAQAATPPPAANRTGFFLGFDPIAYASLTSDVLTGGRSVAGTGVSLRFGWGFSERWALVMDVPVTDLVISDTADFLMSHGDVAVMYLPRGMTLWGRRLVPFLQAGAGFRALESTYYGSGGPQLYSLEGEVFSAGAGLRLYVERSWAIAVQGWWSSGEFNDERIGNTTTHNRNLAATSLRVQGGLEWHRGRR